MERNNLYTRRITIHEALRRYNLAEAKGLQTNYPRVGIDVGKGDIISKGKN